ncbi:MAG: precorrin-3B C(17)-methyltransferase [Pseudomonadota bacterium]
MVVNSNVAVLCLSASGRETAAQVAQALGAQLHTRVDRVAPGDVVFDNALDHARDLFAAGRPIVGVCAAGILIRAVAPLLADKTTEPPVVAIPDDGSTVIPLLGGHRGANRLAADLAAALKTHAAVTTAGDVSLGVALDTPPPGWRIANGHLAKDVMAQLLSGAKVRLTGALAGHADFLSDLPQAASGEDGVAVWVDTAPAPDNTLGFHPLHASLGVGCARNCPPEELSALAHKRLSDAGIAPGAVAAVHSVDLKADEPAVLALADELGVPLRLFSPAELEELTPQLANPSEVVFAEIGCHGVAEAAALAGAGAGSSLSWPKEKTAMATCAIAWSEEPVAAPLGRQRGTVSLIGIGPGQASWRTPEASRFVAEADELVGYGLYIDLLGPLVAGKPRADFPLGGEEARCRYALEEAGKGKNVALVCSGDSGIYAMGALVFELLDRGQADQCVSDAAHRVEVRCAPGVSALQGAAARAGAPLGHDFCAISLSDLLTPREDIVKRLRAAAEGDFVIAFYNPVSKRRRTLLAEARDILLQHRPADTPVMLASSLGRPEEHIRYRRLDALEVDEVDMLTVVLVGSSHSRLARLGEGPRMFTPRGYARKIDGDLAS